MCRLLIAIYFAFISTENRRNKSTTSAIRPVVFVLHFTEYHHNAMVYFIDVAHMRCVLFGAEILSLLIEVIIFELFPWYWAIDKYFNLNSIIQNVWRKRLHLKVQSFIFSNPFSLKSPFNWNFILIAVRKPAKKFHLRAFFDAFASHSSCKPNQNYSQLKLVFFSLSLSISPL